MSTKKKLDRLQSLESAVKKYGQLVEDPCLWLLSELKKAWQITDTNRAIAVALVRSETKLRQERDAYKKALGFYADDPLGSYAKEILAKFESTESHETSSPD